MKSIKLSLITALATTVCNTASANSLQEALTSGKVSGEFAVTYETRDQNKEISNYYQDTAYSVGSFALKYETAKWNNLSLTAKFRAYKTLFEDDDKSITSTGKGDASERFYKTGSEKDIDAEELFLAYDLNNLHIKAGRQFISTEWINKTQDAISLYYNINNTSIEAIWSSRHGRVYARDYRPMTHINKENGGVYKLGVTQKLSDSFSIKAYGVTAPSLKDIYGGKINYKYSINNIKFGAMAHYADLDEDDTNLQDSNILELKTFATINGYTATLGYVQIDEDAAFNHIAGETIIPFEEGDQMFLKDAKTTYAMLSKSFGNLSLTALYGITDYEKDFDKDEFNLWATYQFNKNFKLNVGYALTNEDNKDANTTDLNQLNATLVYSF
ncbi:hypothetical protein CPG38_09140 [Malaciobacter marinus]|uniref:Opr family porin n=1 Tax=Malaciobacter marinus TaxID=505249 RepID=UPI000C085D34|nr:Opr family porin [Malaciobacter marinus]PHO12189.1 hypothetical protein CPG38_09140 [Malaciobacter marinus]